MSEPGLHSVGLDLQEEHYWPDRPNDEFWKYTKQLTLEGIPVTVPSAEDHLRVLCFHFLRHGAVRYSRLCDIAVLLERRRAPFIWNRCLGTDPIKENWIRTTLTLARDFLGARLDNASPDSTELHLPSWLIEASQLQLLQHQDDPSDSFMQLVKKPTDLVAILRRRWPDPVQATLRYPARFDDASRLRLQIAVYVRQIALFLRYRLATQVKQVLEQRRAL